MTPQSPESMSELSHAEARAILGLSEADGPEMLARAFRATVKTAHPDRPGGQADLFREVLEAYRLLQSSWREAPGPVAAALTDSVEITPYQAVAGGEARAVFADGRKAQVAIPAGVRQGETLRIAERDVVVRILADPALQVRGSDLWITVPVAAAVLAKGGRAEVATPRGVRMLWITRKLSERRLVRLEGEGLPARAGYPAGDLFIRLVPGAGAPESEARAQLRRFAAAWAA